MDTNMPSDVNTPTPTPATPAASAALPGIKQLAQEAWDLTKARFGTLIGVNLLPVLIVGIVVLVVVVAGIAGSAMLKDTGGAMSIVMIVVIAALGIGFLYFTGVVQGASVLAIADADKPGVLASYKKAMPRAWAVIGASFLTALIVIFGFILLVIPGIIFMLWYAFTNYTLIVEKLGPINAMKRSKELVKGRVWPVFAKIAPIVFIYFVINWILGMFGGDGTGAIAVGAINMILSFVFGIFMQVYIFRLYEHLKATR